MNLARPVTRFGFGVTHVALFSPDLAHAAQVGGVEREMIDGPLIARCGIILRGQIVVNDLARPNCRHCIRILKEEP